MAQYTREQTNMAKISFANTIDLKSLFQTLNHAR